MKKKRSLTGVYFLLPLGSLFLIAMLFFASKTSGNESFNASNEQEASLELALLYVQNSKTPMKGILMLRDLREKYPENPDVIWHLGQFAMQTGQYEKAETYFEDFVSMAPPEDSVRRNAGMILLSDAYAAQGDHTKAIDLLIAARKVLRDTVLQNAIQERLSNYLK